MNEKDDKIRNLELENQYLKEKLKKYKNVIRRFDENFNFSFISNINQESDLHNINIHFEDNNADDSHILTEQTLIELRSDFNGEYEDEQSSNRHNMHRLANFRLLSERLDETENLNEINICENYFVDRSINVENHINSENNNEPIHNNFENTNPSSPMTTLTNFHNFSERTINIEEMTYEELIDLQDRIGYANKGMNIEDIKVKQVIKNIET
jgi:hypothetical protein